MKSFDILFIFSFTRYFSGSFQQMIGFGTCPDFNGKMKDFDVARYIGVWYEQYRYFITPAIGTTCTLVNLTHPEDDGILYQISYWDEWLGWYITISGIAKFEAPDGEGKFSLDFPARGLFENSLIKLRILDTDYDSYSVAWSCENKPGYNLRNLWIFTREQHPSNETLQKAIEALKKHNMPTKFLVKNDQTDCVPSVIETEPEAEYIDDVDLNPDAEEI